MAALSYAVIIPCKDGEATIQETLNSILSQTIKPQETIVVDDASKDNTPGILRKYPKVLTIRLEHDLPRDFTRVPKLVNLGLARVVGEVDYVMLSGDDCIYPKDYVESLLKEFDSDPRLLICSGSHIEQRIVEGAHPHGAGRIIRYSFLCKVSPFPESIGWESWMLFKASQMGGNTKRNTLVSFHHMRPYSRSSVWTFGQGMYELGYPFWFVLGRFLKGVVFDENKLQQVTMLGGYLEYVLRRRPKLDIAAFVAEYQKQRVKRLILRILH